MSLRSGLSFSYPFLFCRIQGWCSRLHFMWYSFEVVLKVVHFLISSELKMPCISMIAFILPFSSGLLIDFYSCREGISRNEMVSSYNWIPDGWGHHFGTYVPFVCVCLCFVVLGIHMMSVLDKPSQIKFNRAMHLSRHETVFP